MGTPGKPVLGNKPVKPAVKAVAAPKGLPDNVPEEEELGQIPGKTYYFPVTLGGDTGAPNGRPVTGVFLPKNFQLSSSVDIVLFFHGNKQGWTTVHDFWKPGNKNRITLREAVSASGKNVILIAPTMGATPGSSGRQTGYLDTDSADKLIDDVWEHLAGVDEMFRYTGVGKIALAAHSGGGETLLMQTMIMKKYAGNVRAVWGFDCTYDWAATRKLWTGTNAGNTVRFASYRMDVEVHLHHQKGNADTETLGNAIGKVAAGDAPFPGTKQALDRPLRNVHVWPSAQGHYAQLNENFPARLSSGTSKFPP